MVVGRLNKNDSGIQPKNEGGIQLKNEGGILPKNEGGIQPKNEGWIQLFQDPEDIKTDIWLSLKQANIPA